MQYVYSSRRQDKNSELSYKAELSCLSKSSISLPREKKNLQYLSEDRLTTQLVSVLSFSTRPFFFFFNSTGIFFPTLISKFRLMFFFFVRKHIFCKYRLIRTITKIVGNAHETTIIVVQLQNVAVCVKAFNYI